MEIQLTIDELVIEHVSPFDAARLGQSIGAELERLLQERGLPLRSFAVEAIGAPMSEAQLNAPLEQVSRSIAQAIYQVLNEDSRP